MTPRRRNDGALTRPRTIRVTGVLAVLLCGLALACRGRAPSPSEGTAAASLRVAATTPGPTITVVDSVVLQEPPDSALGGFTSFWGISAGGEFLVSDLTNHRVVVFNAEGGFSRYLGRQGSGPGEFETPAAVLTGLTDGQVGVMDLNRSRVLIFDVASGDFVREIVTPFQHVGWCAGISSLTALSNSAPEILPSPHRHSRS